MRVAWRRLLFQYDICKTLLTICSLFSIHTIPHHFLTQYRAEHVHIVHATHGEYVKLLFVVWKLAILRIAPWASISPIPNMKMSKTNKCNYLFLLQQEQKYWICLILNTHIRSPGNPCLENSPQRVTLSWWQRAYPLSFSVWSRIINPTWAICQIRNYVSKLLCALWH